MFVGNPSFSSRSTSLSILCALIGPQFLGQPLQIALLPRGPTTFRSSDKPRRMNTCTKVGEGGAAACAEFAGGAQLNTIESALTKNSRQALQNEHLHKSRRGRGRKLQQEMILARYNRGSK